MNSIEIKRGNVDGYLQQLFDLEISNRFIFRGLMNDNELFPSVYRNYKKNNITIESNVYELDLLADFGRYSNMYTNSTMSYIDWVAMAQHFGLPTRLIDWSFSPFVALFFAINYYTPGMGITPKILVADKTQNMFVDGVPDIDQFPRFGHSQSRQSINIYIDQFNKLINALETDSIKNYVNNYEFRTNNLAVEFKKIDEKEFISKKRDHFFFCKVNNSNPRIIAQRGLFQIPRYLFDVKKEDYIEETKNACETIFSFSDEAIEWLKNKLETIEINTPRLFPDLASICEYLKRKKY